MNDIKKALFRLWLVRLLSGAFFLLRGLAFMSIDRYRGISDLCWVYRVSQVPSLSAIAYRQVIGFVSHPSIGENRLVQEFLASGEAESCKTRFLGQGRDLEPMLRDLIVLKPPTQNEKGVLLLEYSQKFDLFVALFDLDQIMKDYYVVLEPCWAGYCDPSILMFISSTSPVIVQCPEKSDFDFISGLNCNLIPIKLGSSDWIDSDLFAPRQLRQAKEYDLIMVANWAKNKNHRRLFHALQYVRRRPLRLLLVGVDWDGRTEHDVVAEMRRYDLAHVELEIRKSIAAHEVADCLERSKVFLLLSEKEGSNRAIVEALFSDIPAIVYENFIGGARNKITDQTGVLSSFQDLHTAIDYMVENYQRFTPRSWALQHTGSINATRLLNGLLREVAMSRGEAWTTDIVEKVNNPNFSYKRRCSVLPEQQAKAIAGKYLR